MSEPITPEEVRRIALRTLESAEAERIAYADEEAKRTACPDCARLTALAYVIPPSADDPVGDTYQDAWVECNRERDALRNVNGKFDAEILRITVEREKVRGERDALAARVQELEHELAAWQSAAGGK